MAILAKPLTLPAHYNLEPELLEQFSTRPGHQRCAEGRDELLLVLHEVPEPGVPERDAVFFWRRHDRKWTQPGGPGLSELADLQERYGKAIDSNEALVDEADTAAEIFSILRHAGPLARSTRNMVAALEQALHLDPEDRDIRACRDRARELERAAELLYNDARMTLEFWRAERAEEHLVASARLGRIAFRMNRMAAFFLPLMALGGLFGMNVALPSMGRGAFWLILLLGAVLGASLLWAVGRYGGGDDFGSGYGDD